jgi:Asp-tRNA(Asn)/Glu-tRNA(Gln) amidotransferase B subunit
MLLMVKAPTRQHATTARSLADKWREILRFQSRSCEQMNMGMLRLDAIYWTGIDNLSTDEQWTSSK